MVNMQEMTGQLKGALGQNYTTLQELHALIICLVVDDSPWVSRFVGYMYIAIFISHVHEPPSVEDKQWDRYGSNPMSPIF